MPGGSGKDEVEAQSPLRTSAFFAFHSEVIFVSTRKRTPIASFSLYAIDSKESSNVILHPSLFYFIN